MAKDEKIAENEKIVPLFYNKKDTSRKVEMQVCRGKFTELQKSLHILPKKHPQNRKIKVW